MKKITLSLITAMLMLSMIPSHAAEVVKPITAATVLADEATSNEIKALIVRVNEINAMDKSALSSSERKALRKEMREAKRTVNHTHGSTIYISGGLLVLIIVLIILL